MCISSAVTTCLRVARYQKLRRNILVLGEAFKCSGTRPTITCSRGRDQQGAREHTRQRAAEEHRTAGGGGGPATLGGAASLVPPATTMPCCCKCRCRLAAAGRQGAGRTACRCLPAMRCHQQAHWRGDGSSTHLRLRLHLLCRVRVVADIGKVLGVQLLVLVVQGRWLPSVPHGRTEAGQPQQLEPAAVNSGWGHW
jgi:hypothetical protein